MSHETLARVHTHTHTHTHTSILLNKGFLGVMLLFFVVLQFFCSAICLAIVKIDVTGLTTDSLNIHNCNDYAIERYDKTNHWKECNICSAEYVNAGKPSDISSWTKNGYLEIQSNENGEKNLVLKNSFEVHNYTKDYWTILDSNGKPSCARENQHVYLCECGYHYENILGRPEHQYNENYSMNYSYHVLVCSACKNENISFRR